MTDPAKRRTYSGKVTAFIILAVVVVFVVLNVVAGRFAPQPDRPVQPPSITVRTSSP